VHAMQSGIVYGYVGLVDGLVDRILAELGYPCAVIATGGLAPLIAPLSRTITDVDDELTLIGLRILYDRNRVWGRPGPCAAPPRSRPAPWRSSSRWRSRSRSAAGRPGSPTPPRRARAATRTAART